MMRQPSLADRARRAAKRAAAGSPVVLVVTESELDEAKRLCGEAPVVCCTGEDARRFIEYLRRPAKRR